ncbi:MAG: hypothetical protein IJ831_11745 [Spirochaetales bacterium]|nr:hypothetical protein [Spirochaetales bacterium]
MSNLDLESVNRIIDEDFDVYGFSISQISQTSESTQIKSATDNIGTFDFDNPDIRYQKVADRETLDRLNTGMTRKVLRAMQVSKVNFDGIDIAGGIDRESDLPRIKEVGMAKLLQVMFDTKPFVFPEDIEIRSITRQNPLMQ